MLRNDLAHGSTDHYGAPDVLRLGFDIICKLCPDETTAASPTPDTKIADLLT